MSAVLTAVGRHAFALLVAAGGCAGVFGLLLAMNADAPPPPRPEADRQAVFDVSRPERPKPKPKRREPPPRPKQARNDSAAPPPNLGASLSGVDLGIPGMAMGSLNLSTAAAAGSDRAARDMVMTEGAVDVPARPVHKVAPRFPPRAQAQNLEGLVKLELLIGTSGEVVRARVLEAKPPGVFDEAALDAARQWRFEPAMYQGQPVKQTRQLPMRFRLN